MLWSDTCGGQNRNVNMVAFLITLVNDDMFSINKVTQWFLWSGHSYLPSDADFSHIEKKKKDAMGILSTEKYVQQMKNARRNKKFQVAILTEKDFMNVTMLKDSILSCRVDDDSVPVKFNQIHELIFEKGVNGFSFRYHFGSHASSRNVNFKKRNSQLKPLKDLVPAYPNVIKINSLKYRDMYQLLKYIPLVHHEFYKGMTKVKKMNFFLEMCRLTAIKDMMRNDVMLSLQKGEPL